MKMLEVEVLIKTLSILVPTPRSIFSVPVEYVPGIKLWYFKLDFSSSLYMHHAMETQRSNGSSGHWYLLREVSPLMIALLSQGSYRAAPTRPFHGEILCDSNALEGIRTSDPSSLVSSCTNCEFSLYQKNIILKNIDLKIIYFQAKLYWIVDFVNSTSMLLFGWFNIPSKFSVSAEFVLCRKYKWLMQWSSLLKFFFCPCAFIVLFHKNSGSKKHMKDLYII